MTTAIVIILLLMVMGFSIYKIINLENQDTTIYVITLVISSCALLYKFYISHDNYSKKQEILNKIFDI